MADDIYIVEANEAPAVVIANDSTPATVIVGIQGLQGIKGDKGDQGEPGSSGSQYLQKTAAIDIGGNRAVTVDSSEEVIYADNTIPEHQSKVIGLSSGAVSTGETVNIMSFGEMTEPSWNWALNQPVFLATNGQLTQTCPATGFILIVGFPISAIKLFINIKQPIAR